MASVDTTVETLMVPAADGDASCYLARPREGAHPAVLLIPDVFGLRPQIRSMCSRIASWGYVVLAPNLLYREHPLPLVPMMNLRDPDKMGSAMRQTLAWTRAVPFADTAADAAAWYDWLAEQPFVAGERFGVTGYCRGGLLALMLAEELGERICAAGLFHAAGLVTDAPDSLHLGVGRVRAELLIRFADDDPGAPPEAQVALSQALDAAGVRYSLSVYPDAPNGYTMADTPRYQEAGAERHYEELQELLGRTLG
jgi:carboxymethylenebutenolidase